MMEWVMDGRMDCKDGSDEGRSEYRGVSNRPLFLSICFIFLSFLAGEVYIRSCDFHSIQGSHISSNKS